MDVGVLNTFVLSMEKVIGADDSINCAYLCMSLGSYLRILLYNAQSWQNMVTLHFNDSTLLYYTLKTCHVYNTRIH